MLKTSSLKSKTYKVEPFVYSVYSCLLSFIDSFVETSENKEVFEKAKDFVNFIGNKYFPTPSSKYGVEVIDQEFLITNHYREYLE